jgi:hypothetical protein
MKRKPLCGRQGYEGLGLRLDRGRLAAAVMQVRRQVLRYYQAIGMGQLLGQDECLLTPPSG